MKTKRLSTFYYDTLRADRDGTKWGIRGTKDDHTNRGYRSTNVLTAVFDASFRDFRPTTTAGWFTGLRSLKSIEGFEYLNTSAGDGYEGDVRGLQIFENSRPLQL